MSTINRLWESTSKHFAVLCVFARNKKIHFDRLSDLVHCSQFDAHRRQALGIGAASFASVLGTRIGDGNGARSLSLSKCRAHILSEREKTKSEQRYSGKPDGDSRNALIQFIIHNA